MVDLMRIWAMLFWGTLTLYMVKSSAPFHGRSGDESTWGFGQILPTLLLILPLFAVLELYFGIHIVSLLKFLIRR